MFAPLLAQQELLLAISCPANDPIMPSSWPTIAKLVWYLINSFWLLACQRCDSGSTAFKLDALAEQEFVCMFCTLSLSSATGRGKDGFLLIAIKFSINGRKAGHLQSYSQGVSQPCQGGVTVASKRPVQREMKQNDNREAGIPNRTPVPPSRGAHCCQVCQPFSRNKKQDDHHLHARALTMHSSIRNVRTEKCVWLFSSCESLYPWSVSLKHEKWSGYMYSSMNLGGSQ